MKAPAPALVEFWRSPHLPMIEGRRVVDSPRGYRPHSHPSYSIGFVDSGRSRVRLGARTLQVAAGDLVFIPEQLVHACNPLPKELWSYRMLYVDPSWLRQHELLGPAEERSPAGVTSAPNLAAVFSALEALLLGSEAPKTAERKLLRLLGRLLSKAPAPEAETVAQDPYTERAKAFLHEHLFRTVSLTELAEVCGLEKHHLLRRFKRRTGLTPHAFQLDQRIAESRELLKKGKSPVDTAYALGFADQSHFQRNFKPRVAATPGEFVTRKRKAPEA